MRPSPGRILFLIAVVLAALLIFLWWSDIILVRKCESHGGEWDADARVCRIALPAIHGTWT
ncbi:hypothetical protein KY084_06815 [Stakelama sp. CBK3Z-3]|uniref:DUF2125 domain-containing protein n=1 Tax=Stakelama flava TaxID=2860338 RepID=A0ABS6XMF3_9SPHN|nr:hypothetical protein [Stakelama flava]MBW4330586.1 hypothetical protein [Stakelama flava]